MREAGNSSARAWAITLVLLVMLAIIYPLSMGPMFWICKDSDGSLEDNLRAKTFRVVYQPTIWIWREGPPPIRDAYRRYISIWMD